jgi:hypothetical protein
VRIGLGFANAENWSVTRRFTVGALKGLGFGTKSSETYIQDECSYMVEHFK